MDRKRRAAEVRREELLGLSKHILDKADESARDLTGDEERQLAEYRVELKTVTRYLEDAEEQERQLEREMGPARAYSVNNDQWPGEPDSIYQNRMAGRRDSGHPHPGLVRPGDLVFRSAADGRMIRALKAGEPFCSSPLAGDEPYPVGRAIASWMTGRPDDRGPQMQAMQRGGSDTAGGYLFEPQLSQMVVDLARSASVCMRAGATTLPMESNELHLCRVDSDPTAMWRPEGSAVTASVASFGRITLRSHTLACIVPITLELIEDANNAPSVIENCIGQAIAQKMDAAGLSGIGSESEPLGIRNHPGVNTVAAVGTPADYGKISTAVKEIPLCPIAIALDLALVL